MHLRHHSPRVDVRRAEELERACGAAAFRERRAFHHHRSGERTRHPEVGRIWTWIDPRTFAKRPAETRRGFRLPAFHLDHAISDVEFERPDEPRAKLAEREAVAHRHGSASDEAFPTGPQLEA